MIIATFTITFDRKIFPPQLIYSGKIVKSVPSIDFPSSFCLSVNEKYSNEVELIKVLEEFVIPYTIKEIELFRLPANQPTFLIMDVFKGQMINNMLKILQGNTIFLRSVPANLTYLFQLIDVHGGPDGYLKCYI